MSKLRLFTLLLVGSMGMSLHAQQPVRMEYFLDTDPGHGAARQLALTQSGESSLTLDLSDAAPGAHILYMRTQDDRGLWSSTVARPVYVREKTPEPPVRVEYFLDTDPGYGKATPISNLQLGESTMTFDLSHYADGAHVLCVRSQDATGKWSTVLNRPLFIDRFQDIVRVEYFLDGNDPGLGKATAVALPNQDYMGNLDFNFPLDITGLELGEHELSVRALDRYDQWADIVTRRFTIVEKTNPDDPDPPQPPQPGGELANIEYFFDTDPGYGKGTRLEVLNEGTNTYRMSVEGLAAGAHLLSLRAWDDNTNWSQTISRPIYICSVMGQRANRMEYFFDTDPGYGLAHALQAPENGEKSYALPIEGIGSGAHILCLRAQDEQGRWSTVLSRPLYVINPSDGEITALEYFFDNADPGMGKATTVALPGESATEFTFDLDISHLSLGNHQLCVRARDGYNHWSMLRIQPFELVGEGMDIQTVVWTLQVGMVATTTECRLNSNSDRGNCHVEVVNAAGMRLAATNWPAADQQLTLPINAHRGEVVIIRVIDTDNNRTVLRKIRIER